MAKNIRGQFNWIINSNFKEGIDKHAHKRQIGWEMSDKVYGHGSRRNLLDFSKTLNNWIKTNAPEVNRVQKITPELTQRFLQEKAQCCTQNTINVYASNLRKLEILANKTYKEDLSFGSGIVKPPAFTKEAINRGVQAQISNEDLSKVLQECSKREAQSAYAIRLEAKLGLRVQELVTLDKRNIDLENGLMYIQNTKGGKEMVRQLDDDCRELVKEVMDKNFSDVKLFSVQDDSVNKYLREIEKELGLEAHSIHDIRRTVAQNYYDERRSEGYTITEAADLTSLYLNHNKDREKLLKDSYIILR